MFPAAYEASARGSPDLKTPKTLEEYEARALGNPDQKDGQGGETPAVDKKEAGAVISRPGANDSDT